MTARLDAMSTLDALYLTGREYPGGLEALALRMHQPAATLYKKLEHGTHSHHLRWTEGEDIMRFAAAAKVPDPYLALRALAWKFDHICVPMPKAEGQLGAELAMMVVKVFEEGGDVARFVAQSSADGKISPAELTTIEREVEEAMAALASLLQRVRQEAGK